MQLLEQHLGQLGKDEWEIISFTSKPENPLVFHGLARRPVARDWFPPAAAKPAYTPPPVPEEVEDDGKDERSFADELPPSRPANAPEPGDLGLGDFDDLGGSEEDLPTLFDALQPFLRKNPRGDRSVDLDFLAKKFEQDPRELQTAFEECGLKVPEAGKGEVVDHDGSLYWLERDQKGRIWINTRDKKFRTARSTPVPAEAGESEPAPAGSGREPGPGFEPGPAFEPTRRAEPERAREPRPEHPRPERSAAAAPADTGTFLGKIRSMMRRNRRGHGWSGSFQYLTKALKLDDAALLAKLGESGLRLEGGDQPVMAVDGDFQFWLNKNHRGEIWINAEAPPAGSASREQGTASPEPGTEGNVGRGLSPTPESPTPESTPPTAEAGPARAYIDPQTPTPAAKTLPPENTLTAVRLLMQPKKRGEGVTAQVAELAAKLEKTDEQLMQILADAGLHLPASPKAKPTFAEHGGEIYWLNASPKGQVWLNAKQTAARKSRAKKPVE